MALPRVDAVGLDLATVAVVFGTIFLVVCLARVYAGHFTPQQHLGFEFAAWYWHFVDVVWLFLFAFVYVAPYLVWGAGPAGGHGG